jgi:hypothetical protein
LVPEDVILASRAREDRCKCSLPCQPVAFPGGSGEGICPTGARGAKCAHQRRDGVRTTERVDNQKTQELVDRAKEALEGEKKDTALNALCPAAGPLRKATEEAAEQDKGSCYPERGRSRGGSCEAQVSPGRRARHEATNGIVCAMAS